MWQFFFIFKFSLFHKNDHIYGLSLWNHLKFNMQVGTIKWNTSLIVSICEYCDTFWVVTILKTVTQGKFCFYLKKPIAKNFKSDGVFKFQTNFLVFCMIFPGLLSVYTNNPILILIYTYNPKVLGFCTKSDKFQVTHQLCVLI